jgi:hypothetical protein
MMNETEKRREVQLKLLREGFTQDEARNTATNATAEWLDKCLALLGKKAPPLPERQILPPGTLDLADVKSQREEALLEAETAEYYENEDRLAVLMAQSFSLHELPVAVINALLNVLEANGIDRMDAMADIIKTVEFLQSVKSKPAPMSKR